VQRPLPNSYWVVPGKLLAGEYPLARSGADGPLRLKQLMASGVSVFVDLTEPDECPPYEPLLPSGAVYLRFAVPDQDIPGYIEDMLRIQAEIAAAIGTGHCVYLHCRAGIGRTGMAIGCFLAEQGLEGEAALMRLNELWQQSARSASWLVVPQTDEQADYIRHWHRRREAGRAPEPAGLRAVAELRQRFQGALLGLAVGDALAAATQYRRPGTFTPVGDLLGGGPFELPRGAWSDDTAMAMCLAESLVESGGDEPLDQLARYARWQREGYLSATGECVGITAATVRALQDQPAPAPAPAAGAVAPPRLDPEPLSRVAPVVLYNFAEPQRAITQVLAATRVSCRAPPVLDACRRLAAMLQAALHGRSRAEVLGVEALPSGIRFRPHVWLSEEWFSPDGVPGIAVPFYLAHPRLMRLERKMTREVEGGNVNWLMRILRHEAGHAIDSAYRCGRRRALARAVRAGLEPYRARYRARPASRHHVQHLGDWYAQSHPTEDFAETFAVWLAPRSGWQRRYASWPALRKLRFVQQLAANRRPPAAGALPRSHRAARCQSAHAGAVLSGKLARARAPVAAARRSAAAARVRHRAGRAADRRDAAARAQGRLLASTDPQPAAWIATAHQVLRTAIERSERLQLYVRGSQREALRATRHAARLVRLYMRSQGLRLRA
jgi:hypothetical protein